MGRGFTRCRALDPELGFTYTLVGHRLALRFDRCDIGSLRVEGELEITHAPVIDEEIQEVVNWRTDYSGAIEWRGEVRGHCAIDIRLDAQSGHGDLCGFDAFDAHFGA